MTRQQAGRRHIQFGTIAGIAEEGQPGVGIILTDGMIVLAEYSTLAVAAGTYTVNGVDYSRDPFVALSLAGRVHSTDDTVEVVAAAPLEDAACIAADLLDAVQRVGGAHALAAAMQIVRTRLEAGARRPKGTQ